MKTWKNCPPDQNQPKSQFLFDKNCSTRELLCIMTLGLGGAAVPHCSTMSDISKDTTYRVLVCNKTDICYIQFFYEGHNQNICMYQNNQMTNSWWERRYALLSSNPLEHGDFAIKTVHHYNQSWNWRINVWKTKFRRNIDFLL